MPEHTLPSKGRLCYCMTTFLLLLLASGYQGASAYFSGSNGAPNPLGGKYFLDARARLPNPLYLPGRTRRKEAVECCTGQGLPPEPYTTADFPVDVWALVTQVLP